MTSLFMKSIFPRIEQKKRLDLFCESVKHAWKYKLCALQVINLPSSMVEGIPALKRDAQTACNGYVLFTANKLKIFPGYCWDGPSGLTYDTKNSLRASLFHDVLYQAIAEGVLPNSCRKHADTLFLAILKEDGMTCLRRWTWYAAVRVFGRFYV